MKTASYQAIKNALAKFVMYEVTIEPESEPIDGNASAIDPATDAEVCSWIETQLAHGNEYAWCSVSVRCSWRGFEGVDYLGCCSYESREALETDLLEGMKAEALLCLANNVSNSFEAIKSLINGGK